MASLVLWSFEDVSKLKAFKKASYPKDPGLEFQLSSVCIAKLNDSTDLKSFLAFRDVEHLRITCAWHI